MAHTFQPCFLPRCPQSWSLLPGPQAPPTMLVTVFILWASLLTGAWPATPIQDQLPATPRVRLSFKGKGFLCSSLKPSFLTVLVFLQREEEQTGHKD